MIDKAELFGDYIIDFEYVLVSIKNLDMSKIRQSNTLVDNIFLADKKRTREEWTENMSELLHRIREMETEDLNEWITWFSNVIRKLNEYERGELITQIKEGDEKEMCSSFERLLNKEKAEGWKDGRAEGKAEAVIELLEDLGELSDSLRNCIMEQMDLELQKKWLKAAAKAKSIEFPVRKNKLTAKMSWVSNLQLLVRCVLLLLCINRANLVSVPQMDLTSTFFVMPFFSNSKS